MIMTATRKNRRQLTGVVTSTKGAKSITVEVVRTYKHPKYGKFIRTSAKYAAHDEAETANVGDKVTIAATRPISKRKRWRLVEVVGRSILGEDDVTMSAEEAANSTLEATTSRANAGGEA